MRASHMAVIVIGIVVAIDIAVTATAKMTRSNSKIKDICISCNNQTYSLTNYIDPDA